MSDAPFPILFEDNHLLAVVKPASLPTMGVAEGKPSLLSIAKDYLKRKYDKHLCVSTKRHGTCYVRPWPGATVASSEQRSDARHSDGESAAEGGSR